MTEPTLLGVPASEAVGHAVLMIDGNNAIVAPLFTEGRRSDDEFVLRAKSLCYTVNCEGISVYDPAIRALYFTTIPNPMARAPRCGGQVRLVQDQIFNELYAKWKPRTDNRYYQWNIGLNKWVNGDRRFIGWLPCYGATYNPALMGRPEVDSD